MKTTSTMTARALCASSLALISFGLVRGAAAAEQAPALVVVEARGNNEIALSDAADEQVVFNITVLNPGKETVEGVVARLTEFRNARLESYASTLDSATGETAPFKLAGFTEKQFEARVKLPAAGEHWARFYVRAADAQHATLVKVTRTALAPNVHISELVTSLVCVPFYGTATAGPVEIHLHERAGRRITLPPPALQSVVYKPKQDVSFSVSLGSLTAKESVLEPKGSAIVLASLPKVGSAGRYEATLRFEIPDGEPVTKQWTILARQDWYVAGIFILFGVILAALLRLYIGVVQPRLALQGRVAVLFQQLHEIALRAREDPVARQVVERLRLSLETRWNTLSRTSRLVGATDFDIYESKMPLLQNWLVLRLWLPAGLPPDVRKIGTDRLDAAQGIIEKLNATVAEVEDQLGKLSELQALVEQEARKSLAAAVGKLQAAVDSSADPGVRALGPGLDELSRHLESGSLESAFAKLAAVRRQYAEALGRILQEQYADVPLFAIDERVWSSAKARAHKLLAAIAHAPNADAAVATYHEAVQTLLRPQLGALSLELVGRIAAESAQRSQFVEIKGRLDALLTDVDAGRLEDALERASTILDEYRSVVGSGEREDKEFMVEGLFTGSTPPSALLSGSALLRPWGFGATAEELQKSKALAKTHILERFASFFALVIIALIAVGLGIKALWMDDWTWGGGVAYLIAFLWGAGLSGFTFDGFTSLINRFKPS